jgi:hypothetical protein
MTWQQTLQQYLDAEFSHSAGDYRAARDAVERAQRLTPKRTDNTPKVSPAFSDILRSAHSLNELMHDQRFRSTEPNGHRHPGPSKPSSRSAPTRGRALGFMTSMQLPLTHLA